MEACGGIWVVGDERAGFEGDAWGVLSSRRGVDGASAHGSASIVNLRMWEGRRVMVESMEWSKLKLDRGSESDFGHSTRSPISSICLHFSRHVQI